jgi:hypothetical protein
MHFAFPLKRRSNALARALFRYPRQLREPHRNIATAESATMRGRRQAVEAAPMRCANVISLSALFARIALKLRARRRRQFGKKGQSKCKAMRSILLTRCFGVWYANRN